MWHGRGRRSPTCPSSLAWGDRDPILGRVPECRPSPLRGRRDPCCEEAETLPRSWILCPLLSSPRRPPGGWCQGRAVLPGVSASLPALFLYPNTRMRLSSEHRGGGPSPVPPPARHHVRTLLLPSRCLPSALWSSSFLHALDRYIFNQINRTLEHVPVAPAVPFHPVIPAPCSLGWGELAPLTLLGNAT